MRPTTSPGAVALLLLMGSTAVASPRTVATFLVETGTGTSLVRHDGAALAAAAPPLALALARAGGTGRTQVVWTDLLTDAIHTTTSNTIDGYVFSGTYLNPPREARLYALDGGGVPDWGHAGEEFYVDAADDAFVVAAVDRGTNGISISVWSDPGAAAPDWTATFPGFTVQSYGPIALSDDGSIVAVAASPPGGDAHLLLFDAGSSVPLADHVATGLGFPRYMKVSADGRFPAMIALATLVVYDRDLLAVRQEIPMGASNSAMDISGDGSLVAYGWQSMQVMSWNGSSYESAWSFGNPGTTVSSIAISDDGGTIVSTWSPSTNNTIQVVVHDRASATPLWTHDYMLSVGQYQDVGFDIDVTDDGAHFVVGSWGDQLNLNPEVHIFQRDLEPHVYDTHDMPGSVFSVDISGSGRFVTACGKHVHANQQGRGGDLVLLDPDLPTTAVGGAETPPLPHLSAVPNPFGYSTTIELAAATPGAFRLSVFDAAGRRVRVLASGVRAGGAHRVTWDGAGAGGRRLTAGVYVLEAVSGDTRATERVVVLD